MSDLTVLSLACLVFFFFFPTFSEQYYNIQIRKLRPLLTTSFNSFAPEILVTIKYRPSEPYNSSFNFVWLELLYQQLAFNHLLCPGTVLSAWHAYLSVLQEYCYFYLTRTFERLIGFAWSHLASTLPPRKNDFCVGEWSMTWTNIISILIHLVFSWVANIKQKKKLIGHLSVFLSDWRVWNTKWVDIVVMNVCPLAALTVLFMWFFLDCIKDCHT